MKNWIYLVGIVVAAAVLSPSLIEKASAWMLTIELTNKPFGHSRAWVQVEGPYGYVDSKWYPWTAINTSPTTGVVTWDLPESQFPDNSEYRVCVSSNEVLAYVAPYCYSGSHGSGDEAISVALD